MSRQGRMLLVVAAMAVVAVVVLAMIARQYSRVAVPEKSVRDLPAVAAVDLSPAPATGAARSAGSQAAAASGEDDGARTSADASSSAPTVSGTEATSGGDEASPAEAAVGADGALDPDTLRQLRGFVAGRKEIARFIDENPAVADSLLDEATGYKAGRERIKMHSFKIIDLRVAKVKAAAAEGLDEDGYRAMRDRYRAWIAGEGSDPRWTRAFESRSDLIAGADLGKYEPIDF